MKVFIAVVLAIGAVSARGSGPYLPSGWRPQGAAFYLPSEVATPAPSPIQEAQLQETEASGSDAFREYGPPKLEEVSLSVKQDLPDVATEQTFSAEIKSEEVVADAEDTVNGEANAEQLATVIEESRSTEAQIAAEEQSSVEPTAEAKALKAEEQESADAVQVNAVEPTVVAEEVVVPTAAEDVVVASQDSAPVEEVDRVAAGVNNIAEAIANLEKEVKAIEVQSIENIAEISTTQEASGSLDQAPEGFLEYGPPGFTEYGPPKQDDLARLAVEASSSAQENNEVRRRRFSPKFRSPKKH